MILDLHLIDPRPSRNKVRLWICVWLPHVFLCAYFYQIRKLRSSCLQKDSYACSPVFLWSSHVFKKHGKDLVFSRLTQTKFVLVSYRIGLLNGWHATMYYFLKAATTKWFHQSLQLTLRTYICWQHVYRRVQENCWPHLSKLFQWCIVLDRGLLPCSVYYVSAFPVLCLFFTFFLLLPSSRTSDERLTICCRLRGCNPPQRMSTIRTEK